jgi:hypothetical protein
MSDEERSQPAFPQYRPPGPHMPPRSEQAPMLKMMKKMMQSKVQLSQQKVLHKRNNPGRKKFRVI